MAARRVADRPEVGSEPIVQACAMTSNPGNFMAWTFHDAHGSPIFQHYRTARQPTDDDPRSKRYGYRYPEDPTGRVSLRGGWVWRKPAVADSVLYRLPVVLRQPDRTLVLTEGERDCLEFVRREVLASCHHGGAGKFTEEQARSLAGHRGDIVLVADHDAAGAVDVAHRFMELRRVGFKHQRLTIVLPATGPGTDARDHFEAGYGLDDFKVVSYDDVRALIDESGPTPVEDAGYWIEPLTVEEKSQLLDYLRRRSRRRGLRLIQGGVS